MERSRRVCPTRVTTVAQGAYTTLPHMQSVSLSTRGSSTYMLRSVVDISARTEEYEMYYCLAVLPPVIGVTNNIDYLAKKKMFKFTLYTFVYKRLFHLILFLSKLTLVFSYFFINKKIEFQTL